MHITHLKNFPRNILTSTLDVPSQRSIGYIHLYCTGPLCTASSGSIRTSKCSIVLSKKHGGHISSILHTTSDVSFIRHSTILLSKSKLCNRFPKISFATLQTHLENRWSEALSYFNEQVENKSMSRSLSKQILYKTINDTLYQQTYGIHEQRQHIFCFKQIDCAVTYLTEQMDGTQHMSNQLE
jgi:hypothetical protein